MRLPYGNISTVHLSVPYNGLIHQYDSLEECIDCMILFGEASRRQARTEYVAHYPAERNHQGVDNQLLEPPDTSSTANEAIYRRERLDGMLNYYHRKAA